MLLFVFAFLERHNDFQRRTVTVPLSMLLKKLTRKTNPHTRVPPYLCGEA